ncbi:hypothetical protein [Enterococcus nangangensis]|uniref:hypothetical protein n=1 Tax=Enterococcus nangangensis TaxID=2559926 RepID=UPI0010F525D2|nr:hypothetical protein [Enterococcus nangangensis]
MEQVLVKRVSMTEKMLQLAPFLGSFELTRPLNGGTYTLWVFTLGYGISCGERILEIGAKNPFENVDEPYYLGPENYLAKRHDDFYQIASGTKIILTPVQLQTFQIKEQLQGMLEVGGNLLKKTPPTPPDLEFIGIQAREFFPYRHLVTPKGFLCGSYASCVLFCYLQDQGQLTIPSSLREIKSNESEKLSQSLIHWLQPIDLPTIPAQIALGWRRFFHHYRIPVKIHFQSLGAKVAAKRLLQQEEPFILGVLKYFGATYGNHWVVCYAYSEAFGQTFYQIHDNWGDYRKIIAATWGNGLVSVKKRINP